MIKKDEKKDPELRRIHRKAMMLNTKELNVFLDFCKKYKIDNQSRFMREALVTAILSKYDEDAPKLFEELNVPVKEKSESPRPEHKAKSQTKPAVQEDVPNLFSGLL